MSEMIPNRIGFFGGAFSPVHAVHVRIVEAAIQSQAVTKVIVVPSADAYGKPDLLHSRDRLLLLHLAFKDMDKVVISDIDVCQTDFPRPLDTARKVRKEYLREDSDELVWIMGADRLLRIADNGRLSEYAREYRLLVADRPPNDRGSLMDHPAIRAWSERIEFLPFPDALSSTAIQKLDVFREFAGIIGFTWCYADPAHEA